MLSIVRSEAVSSKELAWFDRARSDRRSGRIIECVPFVPKIALVSRGVFDALADRFPFEYVVPALEYVNRVGWSET